MQKQIGLWISLVFIFLFFLSPFQRYPYSIIICVRRHINWNNQRPDLKEDLAHLVQYIKRRFCGIASAGLPLFSVLSFPVVLK